MDSKAAQAARRAYTEGYALARLRELGVVPQDMEIRKADLEAVFLDLTGSHAPTRSGVAA